jgi:uncharacterized protein
MNKHVLFIQGGGEGAYEEDAKLVASLTAELGDAYQVHYPQMPGEDEPSSSWQALIGREITAIRSSLILVGHSFGASAVLKFLSENEVRNQIDGVFLAATPFWGGEGWHYEGFTLQENFPDQLPKNVPIFFYHSRDDETVPFAHLALYRRKLPMATIREISEGGHQFDNDLKLVSRDIKSL